MSRVSATPCAHCETGYHAPFGRFQRVAMRDEGPTFLMRCTMCGTLWEEAPLHARVVTDGEVRSAYPRAQI